MSDIPNHTSPPFTNAARDDALFHYTSANGLMGILKSGELWSTAYFCANDESELSAGKGILAPLFSLKTHEMIQEEDPLVRVFSRRGVDIRHYAQGFEQQITAMALNLLCPYITCFCKTTAAEDFSHGLLSQWRGYGIDGGYALQFSRKKLIAEIGRASNDTSMDYQLQDVHYAADNPLKAVAISHSEAFLRAYRTFLEELADPHFLSKKTIQNPTSKLTGGPLENFLEYLVYTKNQHFAEEKECRLSVIDLVSPNVDNPSIAYFSRAGMIVPYKKTPHATFKVLDCIEWIIVGPGARMGARFKSLTHMIRQLGLSIAVRPSHIPFSRT
jgi:Protein of unknown function (DUF2971)